MGIIPFNFILKEEWEVIQQPNRPTQPSHFFIFVSHFSNLLTVKMIFHLPQETQKSSSFPTLCATFPPHCSRSNFVYSTLYINYTYTIQLTYRLFLFMALEFQSFLCNLHISILLYIYIFPFQYSNTIVFIGNQRAKIFRINCLKSKMMNKQSNAFTFGVSAVVNRDDDRKLQVGAPF